MKILVTGASGRIGANIVHTLLQQGHAVRAAVRPGTPRVGKLSAFAVEIIEADLLDRAALSRTVEGCDAVVHNGVIFTSDPERMIAGSVEATATLLEAARRHACARFVFISSTSVYEGSAYRPGDPVREEEAAPAITGVYGASKLAAEALGNAYCLEHGLKTVSLRLPMVTAGAEMLDEGFLLDTWRGRAASPERPERVSWRDVIEREWDQGRRLVVPLSRDGTPWKRHFCDVRDAARAVSLALSAPEAPGRTFNIASVPVRYDEAAATLAELSGWDVARISFPDDYRYEFALDRAAEFLGYRPAYTGPQMIRDAWAQRQGQEVPGLIAP
jgi:nucleoside-diphosphate-sugar epimerase